MHPQRLPSPRWSERLTGVSGAWRSRDRRSIGRVARVTAHRSVRLGRDAVWPVSRPEVHAETGRRHGGRIGRKEISAAVTFPLPPLFV
jgi:hypothetical protein